MHAARASGWAPGLQPLTPLYLPPLFASPSLACAAENEKVPVTRVVILVPGVLPGPAGPQTPGPWPGLSGKQASVSVMDSSRPESLSAAQASTLTDMLTARSGTGAGTAQAAARLIGLRLPGWVSAGRPGRAARLPVRTSPAGALPFFREHANEQYHCHRFITTAHRP